MARTPRQPAPVTPVTAPWAVAALCGVAFLVEVVALPGTASSFRLPKEALAVGGMAVVAALALLAGLRRKALVLPRGPLTLVLAALPVIQLASAGWASSPRRAAATAAVTALWVTAILLVATLPESARDRAVGWCAAGAVVSAAVLLAQAAGFEAIDFAEALAGRHRLTGLAGNPADFATGAVLLLPLLLWRPEHLRSRLRVTAAAALVLATLVSLTVTAYAALAVVLIVLLAASRSRRAWAAAGAAVLLAAAVAGLAGFGSRLERQVAQLRAGDWYTLLSARGDGWSAAVEMIREHPLLGVGAGNYTRRFYESRLAWLDRRDRTGRRGELATHFEWAHSDPLQLVAELGAVGIVWMAALVWVLVRRRGRASPLPALMAAAATPFLLLHYPTHLAIGLLPLALALAEVLARGATVSVPLPHRRGRMAAAAVTLVIAGVAAGWQVERLALSSWEEDLDARLDVIDTTPAAAQRTLLANDLERRVLSRMDAHPAAAAELWRLMGKARLAGGDAAGAVAAFRTSFQLWPHAEAEMGLGLALAAEGRRAEALIHLGRVTRVNPALGDLIRDPDLRRAVTDLTAARRRH